MKISWFLAGILCSVLMGNTATGSQPPRKIAVSGTVNDGSGAKVSGEFDFRLSFYTSPDAALGSNPLHPSLDEDSTMVLIAEPGSDGLLTIPDQQVDQGLFSLFVDPPKEILDHSNVWYALEVDREGDGFNAEDLLPDLFPIAAVPYAITTEPLRLFTTAPTSYVGQMGALPGGYDALVLTPFQSPPGGVIFDRMVVYMFPTSDVSGPSSGGRVQFAIYDLKGNSVATSPHIFAKEPGSYEMEFEGRLSSSEVYYLGFGRTSLVGFRNNTSVLTPYLSYVVPNTVTDGKTPNHFDPAEIRQENFTGVSVLLYDSSSYDSLFTPARSSNYWFTVGADGETSYNHNPRQKATDLPGSRNSDWWTPEDQLLNNGK